MTFENEYLERLNYLILRCTHSFFSSLFENPYDAPHMQAHLAVFHEDKLTFLIYSNGWEFSSYTIALSSQKNHDNISTVEKKEMINRAIDEACDRRRNPEVFDQYRWLYPIYITQNHKTGDAYFLAFSTNGRYENTAMFLLEAAKGFSVHWKKYIDNSELVPSTFEEVEELSNILSSTQMGQIKQDAIANILEGAACNVFRDFKPILDLVNDLSKQTYEKKIASGTLAFARNKSDLNFELLQPIPFVAQQLRTIRKLLETSKNGAIIVCNGEIVGTGRRGEFPVEIFIAGQEKWNCTIDGESLFQCLGMEFYLPDSSSGGFHEKFLQEFPDCIMTGPNIEAITRKAAQQAHGTSIIISSKAKEEAVRLCSIGRGMLIKPIDLFQHIHIVEQITSIDGAIFIDPDGICYAIGVIVDGIATIPGSNARGARFNSLLTYISWKRDENQARKEKEEADRDDQYLAIVISEDGSTDYFSTRSLNIDRAWSGARST